MDAADRADELQAAIVNAGEQRARRACRGAAGDGICEDCGEPIPSARLEAWPHARRCVECQEIQERAR